MTLIRRALLITTFLLACLSSARAEDSQSLSLAGDWRFEIAPADAPNFSAALTGDQQIHLPGTMDDAHLGPKNTAPVTLEGPYRLYNYAGPAWYQRDIDIPANWANQHVSLFLERCRWVTTVWLDDHVYGSQNSLIAPHVFDLGILSPGKHRLTICVDNTVKIKLGRFVSALFGGTWGNMNGIVGRVELDATPAVYIQDVQVYPDVARMQARVLVKISNATGNAGKGQLTVNGQSSDVSWDEHGGTADVIADMHDAKLWDEFSPNLSQLTVKFGSDQRIVTFGMRDFAVKGTQFTMNGRPIFLRGTLECSVWPLTGYPPTDVPSWERIFKIEKSYGLNFMRFHSWCPPDAAFTAADNLGVMLQIEGPQADILAGKDPARDAFTQAELKRIVDTYGNHPSFCLMTLGNEYGGTPCAGWLDMLKQRDPRHLYSSPSAGSMTGNRQWTESQADRGIKGPGTERDLSNVVAHEHRPIVGHEIGQWMYWPDSHEIAKWTGVMALKNYQLIHDNLAKQHLVDQEPQFVHATGEFATLLYKEEIEVLERTPGYGGFSLLDMHDYPTQGTATVGPLDAFWDNKGFITPESFRQYCSPVVPLLRIPQRTYTTDQHLTGSVDLSNFGPDKLTAQPTWSIHDAQGKVIASGELSATDAPTGQLTRLGKIDAPLAAASAPCKLTVTVALKDTRIGNDWDIWVYPANPSPQPPAGVAIANTWTDAKSALSAGKTVVLFASGGNPDLSMHGQFLPVFWSPVWFPRQKPNTLGLLCDPAHPLFAQFPTEDCSDWQWYNLMQSSNEFILDSFPADFRPVLQVVDNFARNHKIGIIFEAKVSDGKLLVCGFDLPEMKSDPAAMQLLLSLYSYVGSDKFQPTQNLDTQLLEKLLNSPARAQANSARQSIAVAPISPSIANRSH